jgi:hypothetical protein
VTDFIADLETELVAAARRRATARRRLPRPRLTALAAAAAVALIALAAVAAVRGIDGSRTGDERPAAPPSAGPGVTVTLPAALDAERAGGCAQGGTGYAPSGVKLSFFDRPQRAGDPLPGGVTWLPASMVDAPTVRQVGKGVFHREVRLVIAAITPRVCTSDTQVFQVGACVVAGTGPRAAARCFTGAQIAAGAAVTVAAGAAYGIVPDGIDSVELSWDGGSAAATVTDNAYELPLDGVGAGDTVRVDLSGAVAGCAPSAALYEAAPALRRAPEGTPPRALDSAMQRLGSRGDWLAYARLVTTRAGVDVWVVPDMPCDRPGSDEERVCLLAISDGNAGSLLCDTPSDLRRSGASVRSGQVVAGFAPAGARWAEARVAGSRDVTLMAVQDGVFAARVAGDPGAAVSMRFS